MKKILSVFLVLAMLVSMCAAFAVGASAANEPLSAKVYFAQDGSELYLVFNKKVSLPTSFNLSLVGHGWPVSIDGETVYRYLRRLTDDAGGNGADSIAHNIAYYGDSKQVIVFTPTDTATGNYDWYYNSTGPCAQSEAPIAGITGTVDDFCLMVFGTFTTEDGSETLAVEDYNTVNNSGEAPELKGSIVSWNVVAAKTDIVIPAPVAPETEAPATEAPSTEAPATDAPSTEAPSGGNPVTSDILVPAAILAVISLAGLAIYSRKHRA